MRIRSSRRSTCFGEPTTKRSVTCSGHDVLDVFEDIEGVSAEGLRDQFIYYWSGPWFVGLLSGFFAGVRLINPEEALAFMDDGLRVFRVFNKRAAWRAPA